MLVPEGALGFLAAENISFRVDVPATYEHALWRDEIQLAGLDRRCDQFPTNMGIWATNTK